MNASRKPCSLEEEKLGAAVLQKYKAVEEQVVSAQKASVLALDKKFFKQVKGIQDSIEAKTKLVPKALRDKLSMASKHLSILVQIVKAYKAWTRKPDADSEFLAEYEGVKKWADEEPTVQLELPHCMASDITEMGFMGGLTGVLKAGNTEEMGRRWMCIGLDEAGVLRTAAENEVWQSEPQFWSARVVRAPIARPPFGSVLNLAINPRLLA